MTRETRRVWVDTTEVIETIHHGARWCTRLQDACSLASIPYHRLSGDQSSALKRGHHRQMQMSKYRRTTTLVTTPPPEHCLSDTSEGFHHHHQQTQMNNEVIAKRNDTIPWTPVRTRPCFPVPTRGPDRKIDRLPAASQISIDLSIVQLQRHVYDRRFYACHGMPCM